MDPHQANLPRPVEGVDLRTLPIGPEEAFVLSRVDGRSSVASNGLIHDELLAALGTDG